MTDSYRTMSLEELARRRGRSLLYDKVDAELRRRDEAVARLVTVCKSVGTVSQDQFYAALREALADVEGK